MNQYTLNLTAKAACEEQATGGKGANLARLTRYGFQVPPGFVITTYAFRELDLDVGPEVFGKEGSPSQAELVRLHDRVMTTPMPSRMQQRIQRSYRKLGDRVAVRSSMVGEDSSGASFAGQLDTVLGVAGEAALLQATRTCWASLFNPDLWCYRKAIGAAQGTSGLTIPPMAVVVQQMVETQAAGVAFSADPITGERHVVIEAVAGLGTALVQGLVEPDRYIVERQEVHLETTTHGDGAPILPTEQILHLAETVRDVAYRMQSPQDVEWAWDGARLYLLQARPISTLADQRVYSANMVSDMLPGLIKPLVWSVSTTSKLENVMGRVFTELVGPSDVDFRKLAKRIHSRIYADNTLIGQLLEQMGLPPNFFEVMSRDAAAERRGRPPLNLKTMRTLSRLVRVGWRHAQIAGEMRAFLERHDRCLEPYRRADWSSQSPEQLLGHAEELTGLYSETMWFDFLGQLNMMGRNRMMSRLVQRHAPDVPPTDVVRGLTGLKSLETNQMLQRLADQARTLGPAIPTLLMEAREARIETELAATGGGRALADDVSRFLERFGFLSASGTDLSRTPWSEDPTIIWRSIGRLAAQPARSGAQCAEQTRSEAQARVRENLSRPQRYAFDRLLRSTVTYIDLRERTSFLVSEDSYHLRRIYVSLADHLVAGGILEGQDDVFFLAHDELGDLVHGHLARQEARDRVAERRDEMATDAEIDLPDTIYGDHVPTRPLLKTVGAAILEGISGSSGLAEGRARIILDPIQARFAFSSDDILIIPFADTSWTPLFCGVGGVVAETGGQLSHSAIVAREYGLPAVVNVKNATRLIHEGQAIVVDGNRGCVILKEG
ncbi:MAG: PEP/pyruvate-binding domain-containing protein [Anaerolineae bacterium]|jgi:pyruvate,water dikinase